MHDYVIIAVYLILIFIFAYNYQTKKLAFNPVYRYYTLALFARIIGAIALCLVYEGYYKGGDTVGYYRSSEALINLLFEKPQAYFKILFGDFSKEILSNFSRTTGFPWHMDDYESFAVIRVTSIFTFLGFKNYFTTSILFATFFFIGHWKLYLLFCQIYPKYYKQFAIAILFFPSVVFWGSGILKDTITLSSMSWMIYSFYFVFVKKEKIFKNGLAFIINLIIILSIKPYLVVALLPGIMAWFGWEYLKKIQNPLGRILVAPFIAAIFLGIGYLLVSLLQGSLGVYGNIYGIIDKAITTYYDHMRVEQYGAHVYNLGTFDGSVSNFFAKTPVAITAGLFRPFFWDVRTLFMAISAMENTILLIFTIIIFWRTGPVKTIKITFDEPMVIFALGFALVFAFAVGISSGNFGALVRLRTPLLPLFASGLIILLNRSTELKKQRDHSDSKSFDRHMS